MDKFKNIQEKLRGFIKKFYINEIIRGIILFLSFGLLYFIFTLFIEYFLWLKPIARTILFWVFIFVELGLIVKLIIFPILKLIGLQKGISLNEASKIIGSHFHEVDDKLLNVLQLNESNSQSDLLLASIEQKSGKLEPIPFKKAIDFNANRKYAKYLIIPVVIWLILFFTGNNSIFTQSLDRVVHHKMAYAPPAPFTFKILNKNLKAIEGKSYLLQVATEGHTLPESVKINFNGESYYLSSDKIGVFFYEFKFPNSSIEFYFEANDVESIPYELEVIQTPKIIDFEMAMAYPKYTQKSNELIGNTGNAIVPEGTVITWKIATQNVNTIVFLEADKRPQSLESDENGIYDLSKKISISIDYQISASNNFLKDYEQLNYKLQVIRDEHPKIFVKSDIDSVQRGPVQFVGQLSDDYGLTKLQIVAKNRSNNSTSIYSIDIEKSDFEEFYYVFPKGIVLDEGASYEIHFEVFDNDGIHGRKKTKSSTFYYRNKRQSEIDEELLLEQKESLEDLRDSGKIALDIQKALEILSDKLKSKNNTDWNDKKQLLEFLERQEKHQQILERNTEKLLRNLEEMNDDRNPSLEEKKELLKKRIEEAKELQQKKELLKELQELADKLKKEDLLDKVEKLMEQTKQENRSLERILELTKRFYVEKKSAQIMRKLDELAKDQEELSEDKNNLSRKQNKLNKNFDSIKKDFDDLNEQNKDLKSPMNLPDTENELDNISDKMEKAKDNLEESEMDSQTSKSTKKHNAIRNQKSAARKMKELSTKMEAQMMQMEMEGSEENIKDLQQILDNLLIFSYDQEDLMISFENIDSKNADYPNKLRRQQVLKEYFEHIDDSLYALSLRMVRLSSKIQNDLTEAHYNLDKSLENISDNRIQNGISNQHYTMTAANNLADLLSDMLQNIRNRNPGNGSGKGKKGESISLPDIIKKQEGLLKKMKEGIEPGNKRASKSQEQLSGEQYEIYQQQNQLREELNNLLKKDSQKGNGGNKVLQQMEVLENMLLKKGFTKDVLQNMQNLMEQLLKLDHATFKQDKDNKRQAETNTNYFNVKPLEPVYSQRLYFNSEEILIRYNLPLQPNYQKKVKFYFSNSE